MEYVQRIQLSTDQDPFCWKWTLSGLSTAASAYKVMQQGNVTLDGGNLDLEKVGTAKSQIMYLAGLEIAPLDNWLCDLCWLCDQENETIDHILIGYSNTEEI
jgi:hypothetical protein